MRLSNRHPDGLPAIQPNELVTETRTPDTEQFIRQVLTDNPAKGFELLFRRYYSVMHSQATRLVYSRTIADDIVSDVFLYIWQKQAYQHVDTSYRAYLMASVRHAALAHLRRELTSEPLSYETADRMISTLLTAEQVLQYDELSLQIDAAIRNLPTQCQRVYVLSRTESRTNAEIASRLQISIRTVEAHLYKAMRTLKAIVLDV